MPMKGSGLFPQTQVEHCNPAFVPIDPKKTARSRTLSGMFPIFSAIVTLKRDT